MHTDTRPSPTCFGNLCFSDKQINKNASETRERGHTDQIGEVWHCPPCVCCQFLFVGRQRLLGRSEETVGNPTAKHSNEHVDDMSARTVLVAQHPQITPHPVGPRKKAFISLVHVYVSLQIFFHLRQNRKIRPTCFHPNDRRPTSFHPNRCRNHPHCQNRPCTYSFHMNVRR